MVVLDYHLVRGNGLSCLRRLRQLDPIVPVIALSGKATPEIAAELLQAGADNYLSKTDLAAEMLTGCVKDALVRADAWRKHARLPNRRRRGGHPACPTDFPEISRAVQEWNCSSSSTSWKLLPARPISRATIPADGGNHLRGGGSLKPAGGPSIQRILRPVWLEMIVRLWGDQLEE